MLSNVRNFIILLSREGLTPFSIDNRTNFFVTKKRKNFMKLSRESLFLTTRAKTLSVMSYLYSFLSSNLKLSKDIVLITSVRKARLTIYDM